MAETPATPEGTDALAHHSVEWVSDLVTQWIESNETAQALQRNLPDDLQRQLWALPLGHHGLSGAMAMSMNPQTIREAHEWLVSAQAQIARVGLLSHPFVRLEPQGPSDEKTGLRVECDERDRELEQLRRELAVLKEALSGHLTHCRDASAARECRAPAT